MNNDKKRQKRESINAMLAAINKPGDRLMHTQYDILRLISAFPLDTSFDSDSDKVRKALRKDDHALAKLSHDSLLSAFAIMPHGHSIVSTLAERLKTPRGNVDNRGDRKDLD